MCSIIVLLLSCISLAGSSPAPTHLLVTRAGPCYDDQEFEVSVSEFSVTTHTYDSSLSGSLNISQDIRDGWMVKMTIEKCLDIRNIDSCDHFKSYFVIKHGCTDDDETEQDIYNLLFYYTKPRLECPIRAGRYKIRNYPFFTEDNYLAVHESKISTSVFGYIYRLKGYTVDMHEIICVEATLQLRYVRVHNWTSDIHVETANQDTDDNDKEDDEIEDNDKEDDEIEDSDKEDNAKGYNDKEADAKEDDDKGDNDREDDDKGDNDKGDSDKETKDKPNDDNGDSDRENDDKGDSDREDDDKGDNDKWADAKEDDENGANDKEDDYKRNNDDEDDDNGANDTVDDDKDNNDKNDNDDE